MSFPQGICEYGILQYNLKKIMRLKHVEFRNQNNQRT